MKKVVLITVVLFALCGCYSDNTKLIGTWVEDESIEIKDSGEIPTIVNLNFQKGGIGLKWDEFDNEFNGGFKFRWNSTDKEITFYTESGKYTMEYAIIDGNLILYEDEESPTKFIKKDKEIPKDYEWINHENKIKEEIKLLDSLSKQ